MPTKEKVASREKNRLVENGLKINLWEYPENQGSIFSLNEPTYSQLTFIPIA